MQVTSGPCSAYWQQFIDVTFDDQAARSEPIAPLISHAGDLEQSSREFSAHPLSPKDSFVVA